MKKLLAVILCVMCVGCGEKEEAETVITVGPSDKIVFQGYGSTTWYGGYYTQDLGARIITGNELSLIYKYWEENKPILKKIIAEYKSTHRNCDYCEKEFLTAELHKFSIGYRRPPKESFGEKYICSNCKSDLKDDYENMTGDDLTDANVITEDTIDTITWKPEFVGEIRLDANIYTKKVKVKKTKDEIVITLDKKEK